MMVERVWKNGVTDQVCFDLPVRAVLLSTYITLCYVTLIICVTIQLLPGIQINHLSMAA